jgi:ribonuclease HI
MDQKSSKITLLWVPSHVRIPGNETADEAGKKALAEEIQHYEKYPPQDLIKWIKINTKKNNKKNGKDQPPQ